MKTLVCLLLLGVVLCARAEEPDYKALYLQANEAAAQWKARAQKLEAQVQDLALQVEALTRRLNQLEPPAPTALRPVAPGTQARSVTINIAPIQTNQPAGDAGGRVWVEGYRRKDGTYVSGHWRNR